MANRSEPDPVERRAAERGPLSALRDPLYSTLRFIARHIGGFWAGLGAFLTIGTIIGFMAAVLFTIIAAAVIRGITQPLDDAVLRWFANHRTPAMDEVMSAVTNLGDGVNLAVIVAVASAFLWQTRHRWSVYLLVGAVVGGDVLSEVLKVIVGRPRPSVVEAIDIVHSPSFPSGHAMTSAVAYGALAYLVARLQPTRRMRATTWWAAGIIVLGIGVSRVYLGVHYPSDVIGGFIGGIAWVLFVMAALTAIRFFADRRPETRAEEAGLDAEPGETAAADD